MCWPTTRPRASPRPPRGRACSTWSANPPPAAPGRPPPWRSLLRASRSWRSTTRATDTGSTPWNFRPASWQAHGATASPCTNRTRTTAQTGAGSPASDGRMGGVNKPLAIVAAALLSFGSLGVAAAVTLPSSPLPVTVQTDPYSPPTTDTTGTTETSTTTVTPPEVPTTTTPPPAPVLVTTTPNVPPVVPTTTVPTVPPPVVTTTQPMTPTPWTPTPGPCIGSTCGN